MGTLELFDERKTGADGIRFHFAAFSTTSDMSYPEDGCVWINISGGGKDYQATICCADFDERWLTRFVNAFCANIPFRERFINHSDKPNEIHATVTITLDGESVEVDTAISAAILALNGCGAKTAYCCQGGIGHCTPYITLRSGQFPVELVKAWGGAGFRVDSYSVYADAPFGLSASTAFIQSLSDWIAGCLDQTGACYRISEERPNSLPALPAAPNASFSKDIRRLLSKGKKAHFSDFAALKSGRDRFSGMKRDALVALCSEKDIQAIWALDSEPMQLSALRWHLRGLPVNMAIHKVKVDKEISDNAQAAKAKRR